MAMEPVAWHRYSERTDSWSPVDANYAQTLRVAGEKVRPLYASQDGLETAVRAFLHALDNGFFGEDLARVDLRDTAFLRALRASVFPGARRNADDLKAEGQGGQVGRTVGATPATGPLVDKPVAWIGERELQFLQGGSYREGAVFNYEEDHRAPLYSTAHLSEAALKAREECARIADDFCAHIDTEYPGPADVARCIAAAIRNSSPPDNRLPDNRE